jgi:putative ABC transport system permease protein
LLELRQITKTYRTSGETIEALRGISLQFRRSEFVSVLGPSGCGKTTLLNIIGGLDQYTSGDLIINGKSTKDFNDRDWDTYRNHSVGFVFQSYNLIPHQTVLQNVELALTLTGVSKRERRRRAIEALERVGLGDQLKKKPNEISGGQMQRVAIARAIVNDPDIVLADEPTGALDSETSKVVMDILKEISKDRLVVMVTHNAELANQYSTRIIRVLDGLVIGDSAPLTDEEVRAEHEYGIKKAEAEGKKKKPTMSFGTSFGLSLKNLITKKGRTALTSFAGSIGIIGIALIYAVSHGATTYINIVQEDTLSSYPLTLEAKHVDLGTLISTFMGRARSAGAHEKDAVYQKAMIYELTNAMNSIEEQKNDLKSFKAYLERELAGE